MHILSNYFGLLEIEFGYVILSSFYYMKDCVYYYFLWIKNYQSFKVKNVGCKLCEDYTDNKLEKHNLIEKENNLMNFRGKLFLNGRIT